MGDRRLEKSITDCRLGGLAAAVEYYSENTTPNLIVFETDLSGAVLLEQVGQLAEVCDEGTDVLAMGSANDVHTYRSLITEGISDYLVAPFNAVQVFEAIEAVVIDPDAPPRGRIIAFVGSKGGTGSSTLAHNVAWSLAQLYEDDVIILDLDIAFGTASMTFNTETQQGIHDALEQPDRLDEVLLNRYMTEPIEHIKLLAAPASLEVNSHISVESLESLLEMVRRTAPFIVLDIPHSWADWAQHALMQSDEIVLTSTLDLISLRDTKNLIELLEPKRANDAPLRLVINHRGAYPKTELSDKDFESALGGSASLIIAHDPALFGEAANNGQVIGAMKPNDKVVASFHELAKLVSGMDQSRPTNQGDAEAKPGLLSFLKRKGKG